MKTSKSVLNAKLKELITLRDEMNACIDNIVFLLGDNVDDLGVKSKSKKNADQRQVPLWGKHVVVLTGDMEGCSAIITGRQSKKDLGMRTRWDFRIVSDGKHKGRQSWRIQKNLQVTE